MIKATSFILIGGKSERFGSPKWKATISGQSVLDQIWNSCDSFEKRYVKLTQNNDKKIDMIIEGIHCAACIWLNEKILSETSIEVIISGDRSFGSCDIPFYEAKKLDVDLIVHLGHTPFPYLDLVAVL